ncbi:hypothetical protein [Methanococcoides alaskense]|uniref:Uncharacterized protein n=1 Tax=Methanococcoides alaskense TaxID=325778 RepID=A0AA90TXI8_9EURY|nr:hypothetical protein [Methanococcoides alaskense]MDA0525359.1 hypothetical protein [Methanococcoides alaskense]MDR6221711.1 hypothetical protein [Methanococcoides alaskense]
MVFTQKFNLRIVELVSKNQKNIRILAILLLIMTAGTKIALNIDPVYAPMGTVGGLIFGMNLTYYIFQ